MDVPITTLTPLWTGGVETGKVDRLHETGILGSMRWWMEALVRGMGGNACDPARQACLYDPQEPNNGICDVCRVFGATGWRRRFRMEIVNDETQPIWADASPLNIRPPERTRGWYLPPGRMGSFVLRFRGDEATLTQLATLLLFMEQWGSLGAKAQLGYGAFALQDRETIARIASWSDIPPTAALQETDRDTENLPNLRYFGFFRYRFRPHQPGWWTRLPGFERIITRIRPLVETYQTVPVAPVLKNVWRFQHWRRERDDAGGFWGMLGQKPIRSKVQVSWAYLHDDMWALHGSAWLHGVQATPVWAMLSNVERWNQTLGVEGALETFPAGEWRPWSAETVRAFLEQTISQ
jgi:CRISPR-associated protein Cmr1